MLGFSNFHHVMLKSFFFYFRRHSALGVQTRLVLYSSFGTEKVGKFFLKRRNSEAVKVTRCQFCSSLSLQVPPYILKTSRVFSKVCLK